MSYNSPCYQLLKNNLYLRRKELGKYAEDIAVGFLKRHGIKIIKRNFSCRLGEIDIIAKDNDIFVFVEVRSGRSPLFHHPLESITNSKIKRLKILALNWLNYHRIEEENLRFDIITVVFNKTAEIEHIRDAF